MNKRIRELAIEATLIVAEPNGFDPTRLSMSQQRFAELIVRECLNQCYNRGMNDGLYAGQLQAASYIEEHFGVENEKD
tara:strand:+ start:449 stop:682 length:234 start_codon:yes stop_codon:yes gene_type:complete